MQRFGKLSDDLREVAGHFTTGLTVLTAASADRPIGITCQSFTSVSLDPPLICVFLHSNSRTLPKLLLAPSFVVNILSEPQAEEARFFASHSRHIESPKTHDETPSGAPMLSEGLAWIECTLASRFQAGDHVGILANVIDLAVLNESLQPLCYFKSEYCSTSRIPATETKIISVDLESGHVAR